MSAANLSEYLRDAIYAKWEAEEDRLEDELRDTSWWRFVRRSMIRAELRGINRGLLEVTFWSIDAQVKAQT